MDRQAAIVPVARVRPSSALRPLANDLGFLAEVLRRRQGWRRLGDSRV
jgi:hypothetical protein